MNNKQKTNSSHPVPGSYKIPEEGSLGLLALGARGIMEWRKVRDRLKKDPPEEKQSTE